MSQKITNPGLAIDILEFLLGLVRLPDACSSVTTKLPEAHISGQNEDGSFYKTIFGICTKYIQSARERANPSSTRNSLRMHRQSGIMAMTDHMSDAISVSDVSEDLSEYVHTIAYHVIIFWFLAIDVTERSQHVGWIAKELAIRENLGKDTHDREFLDEQGQVILDMMHRTTYSDLGETESAAELMDPSLKSFRRSWLTGTSILTLETVPGLQMSQFTKRQASGTTHALHYHKTSVLPEHHIRDTTSDPVKNVRGSDVYLNHVFLQLVSSIAPIPVPLQPVHLPEDEFVERSLRNLDRIDTVDGHKAGIIYVAQGQSSEVEILANTQGDRAFDLFLSSLGTQVKLQGAKFNTQGLDRESGVDGTHTYAWRDRIAEIVFHVPTMMPTDVENDPTCTNKKRHIGNDRVKIIFNNSYKPFAFNTFPSDFNEVNIIITPESQIARNNFDRPETDNFKKNTSGGIVSTSVRACFYIVELLCAPEHPYCSPASSSKIISAEALPGFVRQLTLNASVFCQVWAEVRGQGKYISNWRARLQEIHRLRTRYGNTHSSANISYPIPATDLNYSDGDEWKGRVTMGGLTELSQLLVSLDFTRWT